MEIWRTDVLDGKRPEVLSRRTVGLALVLHIAVFLVFALFALCHGLFEPKEEILPIDLTVVVNENLDGKENEPPPLVKEEPPPPPKPKKKSKPKVKKPDPPKNLEQIVTNIVTKVEKKEEKKEEPKPAKKPEPEVSKKTAKELREERLKRMRDSAKTVNKKVKIEVANQSSGDGRTDKKTLTDDEVRKLLSMGYKAGTSEQLAANDKQLGFSLIKMAIEAKWETPPWTADLRPMVIRVWFGAGGRVLRSTLEQSSGDPKADQSIKAAVARVGSVPGLPESFIKSYRSSGVPCRFSVKPH